MAKTSWYHLLKIFVLMLLQTFLLLKLTILFYLKYNCCCTFVCANQIFLIPPLLPWKQGFNYMAERHFAGATKARSGWLI